MHTGNPSLPRLLLLLTLAAISVPAGGQEAPAIQVGNTHITGVPEDWTHHHVVFGNPGTEQEAISAGRHEQWLNIVNDPRYVLQQLRKNSPVQGPAALGANLRAKWTAEALGAPGWQEISGPNAGLLGRSSRPIELKKKGMGLAAIKQDWNETVGATTAPNPTAYPAKWNFSTTSASCASDFVIYPTAGSGTQASIMAYYNLYTTGCTTGTVPSVDWAYNTGGTVSLSPVLSISGNEIAFVQESGTAASLVLLRFPLTPPGTGTLAAPITPNLASSASNFFTGSGCATPCMFKIAFSGASNDTWSNPFYDYTSDSIYVGDSAGKLHKFSPVFNGAPAELGSPWPAQLARGATSDTNQTASPAYDTVSGYVFAGTINPGGYLYSVGSGLVGTTAGSIHGYSAQIDATFGVRDAPLVDSSAGEVYVFAGRDPGGNNGVFQFATSFGAAAPGTEKTVGTGGTGVSAYQFAGTFDNTYYTSSDAASPSGNIYLCGTGAPATLYQIAIASDVMGTVTAGPAIGNTGYYGRCSPITEFFNANAGGVAATGTATIASNPGGWAGGAVPTVTIGATAYTFVAGSPTAANEVEKITTGGTTASREEHTAQNFEAVINATSSQCFTAGCVFGTQAANASATASYTAATTVVDLTAKTTGTSGNFNLTSSTAGDVAVSGGSNGVNPGTDYMFLSVYDGTGAGCTSGDGCVLSYDVTTPSSFGTGITPGGVLNVTPPTTAAPTGGIIIDNSVQSLAGASQIYFVTQSTAGTTPCTGVCAVQASQSAP